jgi:hypothetical protein
MELLIYHSGPYHVRRGAAPAPGIEVICMIELKHKELVNCSWCSTVKRRDTHEPIAEPLQTQLKKEIESHGMCNPCADDIRRSYKMKKDQEAQPL